MLDLKKAYEKANNMLCSNKTFEELRYMVGDFNDLYTALDSLNQLEGKTIGWSIYGDAGNAGYGPLQVGWDYAKLLLVNCKEAAVGHGSLFLFIQRGL